MRAVKLLVVTAVAVVVLAMPSVVVADGRVALVVGNSTYSHIGRLPNPENDAADISSALRRLGFEVTTAFDADRVELTEALRAFTRRSAGADVSLVFYAGHGIEMDGVNYLVPVDARLDVGWNRRSVLRSQPSVLEVETSQAPPTIAAAGCRAESRGVLRARIDIVAVGLWRASDLLGIQRSAAG